MDGMDEWVVNYCNEGKYYYDTGMMRLQLFVRSGVWGIQDRGVHGAGEPHGARQSRGACC
jgi:hypothetical protein